MESLNSTRKSLLLVPLITLLAAGCASMNESECVTGDWYTIGFEDGSLGHATSRVGQHRKACAKHGVAPDFAAYHNGRQHGLEEYCQPAKGFNLGAGGGHYTGVCPAEYEDAFLASYNRGAELYTLRRNVQNTQNLISAKEAELKRIKNSIRTKQAALIASETSVQDRILLLADIKDLSEQTGEIETEIDQLIFDLANHERELTAYEATLASSDRY
jgi:hypothetical protein